MIIHVQYHNLILFLNQMNLVNNNLILIKSINIRFATTIIITTT